jgi:hypothetical protein
MPSGFLHLRGPERLIQCPGLKFQEIMYDLGMVQCSDKTFDAYFMLPGVRQIWVRIIHKFTNVVAQGMQRLPFLAFSTLQFLH